ncbi:hypothetical protein NPIL_625641 [Nephila pilipes]|uniref:Uncharacterized protein n=1 Tax=Nephila pilipes TaxID=299642 RepID=A0A8X6U4J9_NEPPI|nr:hypothetical protein NPIL_625641 [Nephila pilipes]
MGGHRKASSNCYQLKGGLAMREGVRLFSLTLMLPVSSSYCRLCWLPLGQTQLVANERPSSKSGLFRRPRSGWVVADVLQTDYIRDIFVQRGLHQSISLNTCYCLPTTSDEWILLEPKTVLSDSVSEREMSRNLKQVRTLRHTFFALRYIITWRFKGGAVDKRVEGQFKHP